ncbi:DUF4249 domain-containing protein [Spirosoma knui]
MVRLTGLHFFVWYVVALSISSCVYPEDLATEGTVNVVVVESSITNLDEPQLVRLNRSKADPFTGRFGTRPLTGATVDVLIDSVQRVRFTETDSGRYQAPASFVGQIGHRYQLQFTLKDGTHYVSATERMPAAPPIRRLYERFNPTSLNQGLLNNPAYRAANDIYIDWQDPADQANYYRWDWVLWEKQLWCRSCRGSYLVYAIDPVTKQYTNRLLEDCYYPDPNYEPPYIDYECRTECWEKLFNYNLTIFADTYTNGRTVTGKLVAQIPYYQYQPCLVEIRQSALTAEAYSYFKRVLDQTQNAGGLANTPPAAPTGNVHNGSNSGEAVVGYFAASAVSAERYLLDRRENTGNAPGLFRALNANRDPTPEPPGLIPYYLPRNSVGRPPTAVCVDSDNRTPNKPQGWPN